MAGLLQPFTVSLFSHFLFYMTIETFAKYLYYDEHFTDNITTPNQGIRRSYDSYQICIVGAGTTEHAGQRSPRRRRRDRSSMYQNGERRDSFRAQNSTLERPTRSTGAERTRSSSSKIPAVIRV